MNNAGWYPYNRAPSKRLQSQSKSSGKTVAIVIVVLLLLGGLVGGLTYYFMTRTPADSTTPNTTTATNNDVKFLPFGPSVNDLEASSNDVITYTVPDVNYTMLGASAGLSPVGVQPKIGRGAVFVGVMESGTMSTTNVVKILVHGAKDIRPMDTILGEHFYYREGTNSDKQFMDCLISSYQAAYAYVFTWQNVVSYDTQTNVYTRIGTFQAILAFDTNSTVYCVRSYASNVKDATSASGQFKTYEASTDTRYDVNLVAADVRNKRLITPYSEAPSGLTLTQLPDNKDCIPT